VQTTPGFYRYTGLIAILGLLTLLLGFVIMLALPEIKYASWGILALGVLLLAIAFIIDFRQVSRALTGRRGQFGTGATVMASIFIGITLIINAISLGNYHRFDLTGVAQFTLTSQTKEVLSDLDTPVKVLAFFTPSDFLRGYTEALLTEYKNRTDKISVEFIDPDEHPDQARQYGIMQYQTVVFANQNQRRIVPPQEIVERAENAFTSAILEVTGVVQKKIYFLTGHGESNINSTTARGYSAVRDSLRENLYRIETLDLLVSPSIPEDCTVLIIAGPQQSLISGEVDIIQRYLEEGGWVLVMINPDSPLEIRQLLSLWAIDIKDGIVIDPSSYLSPNIDNPSVPRTRNLFQLPATYFPGATAVIPQEEIPENIETIPVVWTSPESWLEKDFDPNKEPELDEDIEQPGSLAIGAIITTVIPEGDDVTGQVPGTRLAVFGDSDFASNQHFYNGDNGNLFLNSVNLLTTGKELISIERKVLPFRRLVIGPEAERFIYLSSISLLPVLMLLAAGIIWWRRR